ncbi:MULTISPECIES: sodium-dependent transporter [Pasteurellaceae]|uniref:sodium-dependent transporter n=1 Tax=Pasteurellaceae TaxID=712 RepID=UPI0035626E04
MHRNTTKHARHAWSSQLTYILTVAGATVGFGATWRFPYLVGENGGGAYVLLFCIAMIIIGIPMILVENVIGRRMQVNAIDAFGGQANGKKIHPGWKILGYMGLLGAFGILAYYMVLGGWVLTYIGSLISGDLDLSQHVTIETTSAFFNDHIRDAPKTVLIYTALFVAINYVILIKGIKEGIERSVKMLMPLLFIFLMIMIVRNITLPGAMEGIKFYLVPDFSKISNTLFVFVLGQVFFALSLGFGVLITLSSYLSKQENLVKTAMVTGVINTLIALAAGFMIFPSLFTFNVAPNSGPTLVFQSLPIVFSHMWAGTLFAVIFFALLITAALTTSITIYEVLVTALQEKTALTRGQSISVILFGVFVCGNVPSVLGDNLWRHVHIMGLSIFDAFDYASGNILFILTALGSAMFVGYVLKDEAKRELGAGKKLTALWFNYVRYVIPVIILVIFIHSL